MYLNKSQLYTASYFNRSKKLYVEETNQSPIIDLSGSIAPWTTIQNHVDSVCLGFFKVIMVSLFMHVCKYLTLPFIAVYAVSCDTFSISCAGLL